MRGISIIERNTLIYIQVPVESCILTPRKACKKSITLVPFLKQSTECIDIPNEVCQKKKVNPKKIKKPIIKRWCYNTNTTTTITTISTTMTFTTTSWTTTTTTTTTTTATPTTTTAKMTTACDSYLKSLIGEKCP